MAADKEWFQVELPHGVVPGTEGAELPNKEVAIELARRMAPEQTQPLTVVKYTRREIRTFTKRVLVDEADISTGAVSPA